MKAASPSKEEDIPNITLSVSPKLKDAVAVAAKEGACFYDTCNYIAISYEK